MANNFSGRNGISTLVLSTLLAAAIAMIAITLFSAGAEPPAQRPVTQATKRVKRPLLWPQFQKTLLALGDRFEVPGKERLILSGTIRRISANSGVVPMRMIVEMPDRFRLEEQIGNQLRLTTFDGETREGAKRFDGEIQGEQEEDELESLIFDGVEHLFAGQMAGLAKREIGQFLQPGQTTSATYTGPYYNVYEVMDRITHTSTARIQRKLYYFNVNTSLPEIIRYQVERSRGLLRVEVRLDDWQSVGGQTIPGTFVRSENDTEVLRLSLTGAVIQAATDDGIFTVPGK